MEQELSARERIMAAFVAKLEEPHASAKGAALSPRIAALVDGHFRRYCSFYDRDALLKSIRPMPLFYLSFLSRPTEIERVSVSALAKTAGVNRTTFYKLFPNVNALYDACCDELADKFLSVPLPPEKTAEAMHAYGMRLWRIMEENNALLFTLSHRVNKRDLPYQIGCRLRDRLAASLTAAERASFRATENVAVFPDLFSVWFSMMHIRQLAPDLYPDQNMPVYRPERSLIENIAAFFAQSYGGSEDFYYTMGGAVLKLLSEKRFYDVSVSELCQTAGYPRSTFYAYFTDYTDYVMKIMENSVMVCLAAFLYFLEHQEELTPEALAVFRGELVDFKIEGIRSIFLNGSIVYIFSVLFCYLMRIFNAEKEKHSGAAPDGAFVALESYYIGYAMRLFSMNYLGIMTDAELFAKRKELDRIRRKLEEM